ncbi:MAG: DMT family transporter [Pseudomonadota bacterium]
MARASASTLAAVALIGLLWGLNWPAVKTLLSEMPPITIRAVSLTVASILLGLWVWLRGDRLRPAPDETWPLVLAGLLTVFGFNILVTFGQILTETSRAAIIAYIMPALTAMLSVIFLGERLGPNRVLALVLAVTGVGVMASENLAYLIANPLGPLIMLGSAISWALGIVASKARTWTLGPAAQAVWFLGTSALLCWPLVALFEPVPAITTLSPTVLWVLAFHILGPMLLCYALWTTLVSRLPGSVAALATLLAPVVAVSSSMALLGDAPTWQKLTALALIVASIALTFLRPLGHRTE